MANIKVYARLFPCQNPCELVSVQDNKLCISKPRRPSQSRKNGLEVEREIALAFSGIFGQDCSQRHVFEETSSSLVYQLLEGYNGTIFAYGQSGTGKTYTVEGEDPSKERSPKHGLIPHILSLLYKLIESLTDDCVSIQVSFLEIYKELAYDLLGSLIPGSNNRRDLPRVLVTLDSGGACIMHGLSRHNALSEYEACKLHIKGRMNRMTNAKSNKRSSRSHTIFTILFTRQEQDSEVIVKSKLNIVDLAGSDRVAKPGLNDDLLAEAKCIDLSLHYLETVIIALQNFNTITPPQTRSSIREQLQRVRCKSAPLPSGHSREIALDGLQRDHQCSSTLNLAEMARKGISIGGSSSYIPYRNSLLTMVLQDSLGGNCNTTMIATLSLEKVNLKETLSTCWFAQRAARVVNTPLMNQEIDEGTVIRKLKEEIVKLRDNNPSAHGEQEGDEPEDPNLSGDCIDIMDGFLEGRCTDPVAHGIDSPKKFRACLMYLRNLIRHRIGSQDEPTSSDERDSGVGMNCGNVCADVGSESTPLGPLSPTETIQSSDSSLVFTSRTQDAETQTRHQQAGPGSNYSAQTTVDLIVHKSSPMDESIVKVMLPKTGRVTQRELMLWEMDIQKANLIQKWKAFSSALASQHARVLVIERHGGLPDELENERIAEQHLLRKQAEVERKLSVLIKDIAELSSPHYPDHLQEQRLNQNQVTQGISSTNHKRQQELRELSTQQKLLSCRAQLERGLKTAPSPSIPIQTMQNINSRDTLQPHQNQTSPNSHRFPEEANSIMTSSKPGLVAKGRSKSGRARNHGLGELYQRRLYSPAASGRAPEGVIACSPYTRSTVHFTHQKSKCNQNTVGCFTAAECARSASNNGITPSVLSVDRVPTSAQTSTHVTHMHDSMSQYFVVRNNTTRVSQGAKASLSSSREDPTQRENMRVCRPATCMLSRLSHQHLQKKTPKQLIAAPCYEFDQTSGFITHKNETVYRNSSFVRESSHSTEENSDAGKGNGIDKVEKVRGEGSYNQGGVTANRSSIQCLEEPHRPRPPRLPPVGQEDSGIFRIHQPSGKDLREKDKDANSNRRPGVSDGGNENNEHCSLTASEARRQHVERVRKIRQVTQAVSVIQRAFKNYVKSRESAIHCTENMEPSGKGSTK